MPNQHGIMLLAGLKEVQVLLDPEHAMKKIAPFFRNIRSCSCKWSHADNIEFITAECGERIYPNSRLRQLKKK